MGDRNTTQAAAGASVREASTQNGRSEVGSIMNYATSVADDELLIKLTWDDAATGR